jgi:hypothetical protein
MRGVAGEQDKVDGGNRNLSLSKLIGVMTTIHLILFSLLFGSVGPEGLHVPNEAQPFTKLAGYEQRGSVVNTADEGSVMGYIDGKSWVATGVGRYDLHVRFGYISQWNTWGFIFWTLDEDNPTGLFTLESVRTGATGALLKLSDPEQGHRMQLTLLPDGNFDMDGHMMRRD